MRRLALLALASLLGQATARCTGTLIHFGGDGSSSDVKDISASTARTVIAERLGRTEDMELKDLEKLQDLEEFRAQSLLKERRDMNVVVRVVGVDVMDMKGASYCVSDQLDLDGLFDDSKDWTASLDDLDFVVPTLKQDATTYITADFSSVVKYSGSIRYSLSETIASSKSIIYLLTSTAQTPSTPSLRKRQNIPTEAPLASVLEEAIDSDSDSSTPQDDSKPAPNPHAYKRCYRTLEACESGTANCSGHGKCVSGFVKGIMATPDSGKCFVCKCEPTKGDGKKGPTVWAGLACQKQDVSIPFNLFVSLGVVLVVMVGSAVGLMYGVGREELPPVLGAGVGQGKKTN